MVVLYGGASLELESVNEARKHLFAAKTKSLQNLPPTSDALELHTLRAIYQGGHIWGKADTIITDVPSAAHWGWTQQGEVWTTQPAVCHRLAEYY